MRILRVFDRLRTKVWWTILGIVWALGFRWLPPIAGGAKYGSDDLVFKIDASDGGALQDMSQHIDEIGGYKITKMSEESHTFGDSWVEHLLTGIRKNEDFTVGGLYDDTAATGPDATFNGTHAVTRTVEITWGGTKKSTFEAWIVDYERKTGRGNLTRWSATIRPTGAVTEA
ncbi:MAG: hypothetical protein HW375_38 [Anaerolineales bacterium]|nr:hypothetical protein [Anaerolineales bacterium]